MKALFLNLSSADLVSNLHHSLAKHSLLHDVDEVLCLPRSQHYCHCNPLGSKIYTRFRRHVEMQVAKAFPHAEFNEINFDGSVYKSPNAKEREKIEVAALSSLNNVARLTNPKAIPSALTLSYEEFLKLGHKLFGYANERFGPGDQIFCFNGRFIEDASMILGLRFGVDYYVYDIKDQQTKTFYLFKNTSLHSVNENCSRALKFYAKDIRTAKQVASRFIDRKLAGIPTYERSYTKHQNEKFLRPSTRYHLSIFPSSDDEYRFLGEEWNGKVVEQVDEIESFLKVIHQQKNADISVSVKMHPNMIKLGDKTIKKYTSLEHDYKNVKVFLPLSKTNSYDIVMKSDTVVVFCSTIGVEANYLGRPVLGIGGAPYQNIPAVHYCVNGVEAAKTFLNSELKQRSKTASIIWMNYLWKYSDINPGIQFDADGTGHFTNTVKIGPLYKLLSLPARISTYLLKLLVYKFQTHE